MNYSKFNLIIILFFIFSQNLKAQSETVYYSQSNDTCVTTTVNEYDKLLKYFIADKTEINQLYKVDLFQLALGRINFAYEHRLMKNKSIELSFEFSQMQNFNSTKSFYSPFSDNYFDNEQIQYLSIEADYRIYTNINRRLKNGKNTNGFSANYITLGFASHFWFFNEDVYKVDSDGRIVPIDFTSYIEDASLLFRFGKYIPNENLFVVKPGIGLQRRIGNIGYLDAQIKCGVGTNSSFSSLYVMPEINIKAGFAISSLKRKR